MLLQPLNLLLSSFLLSDSLLSYTRFNLIYLSFASYLSSTIEFVSIDYSYREYVFLNFGPYYYYRLINFIFCFVGESGCGLKLGLIYNLELDVDKVYYC